MKVALTIAGAGLVGGAVWLSGGQFMSPWVALAAAALMASGLWFGLALGVLALFMAMVPMASPSATGLAIGALIAGGLALGLLAREFERTLGWSLTSGARRTGVWMSALLALLALLPDGRVALLDGQGAPLGLIAQIQDAPTGVAGRVHIPAVIDWSHPAEALLAWVVVLSVLSAFVLLRQQITPVERGGRAGWTLLGVSASLVALSGAWGLAELLGGGAPELSPESWALALTRSSQGTAVTGLEIAGTPNLGLLSRPLVDPLRLVLGACLCGWVFGPWRKREGVRLQGPRPGILLAVAAACLGVLLDPGDTVWVVVAGALLAFGSVIVAGRQGARDALGEDLVALAIASWLMVWLTPAWSGTFG